MTGLPPNTRAVNDPDPAGDHDALTSCVAVITGATPGGPDPGTGTVTAQKAINTLAGAVTSGLFLRGNGTNILLAAIQAGDIPALSYAALLTPTGVKTANYTASAGDLVPCDTSGGAFTITAPTAPAAQAQIAVLLINGTNPVTIAAGGTDVFDKAAGPTSVTLYPGPGPGPSAILLQYRASGNIWYRYAGYNPSPLTTLGDMPYGGTGGAPTRLAGNTSATKNFFTQTGNGTVSAAPAWGTIAAGDIPNLPESQITNLVTDLAAKAADSAVVHLSGTETVTGAKTFNLPPNLATQSVSGTATLAAASAPVVLTDTTSAAFTLTLPATPVTGQWFIVVDDTGQWNTHNLTIGRNGKNIDGAASNLTLANQWGKVWLYYDGTAWWILAAGASNETPAATGTTATAGTHNSLSRSDHGHVQNYGGQLGDGSDGAVNFDGTSTVLGLVPAAGVYTLTRDIFCTTLQVGGGGTATTILTNGWRIFHTGTATNAANGTISAAGNAAATLSNNHGAGGATGTGALGGGRPGSAGVATGGAGQGTASAGVGTGAPGAGGNGSTGTGGASIGGPPGSGSGWLRTPFPVLATALFNSSAVQRVDGGGGGSGGGGDGTNFGGGGGSGGGVVAMVGAALVNNGTITAAGGNGGTPSTVATNGGCGGGGGGAGGLVLTYTLSAPTGSGSMTAAGGNGGTKVTNGSGTAANGGNGANGVVLNITLA